MASIQSPSNLELLLHCHVSPAEHPRMEAPAIQAGIRYLSAQGLIEPYDRTYQTTAKGKFFIEHLMKVPFPEVTFSIPEVK